MAKAKFNVDDILRQVGVTNTDGERISSDGAGAEPGSKDLARRGAQRVDQAEQSFGALPSVPANQRGFGGESVVGRLLHSSSANAVRSAQQIRCGPARHR